VIGRQRPASAVRATTIVKGHTTYNKLRIGRPDSTTDRYADFKRKKGTGFEDYRTSLYAQDWFDSSTERDVANILEDAPDITL